MKVNAMLELPNIISPATFNLTTANLNASLNNNETQIVTNLALLENLITTENPLNDLFTNATTAAYEIATQWISSTLANTTGNFHTLSSTTSSSSSSSSGGSGSITDSVLDAWLPSGHVTPWGNRNSNDNYRSNQDYNNNDGDDDDGDDDGTVNNNYDDADDVENISPCMPGRNFNCSRQAYLEFFQGPQRLPLYKALLVTITFGGIFLTGILGNVLVCVVIVRHSTMHTATNYYLFSLAVSDLLYLAFGLPTDVFLYWHQYPYLFGLPFCKIRAFISEASTYVSVLTIVAFSMERFLAICHPLHLYAMSGFKRALRIIAVLWVVSFISATPFGLMSDIGYVKYPADNSTIWESAFCAMMKYPDNFPVFELSFCVFFVIPMILIIILYWRMGAQIRSRTTQQLGVQQGSMHKESKHQQSRKAVIRMLAAVVITFFVCWLPFHMQRLWFLYAQKVDNYQEINEWMFSITGFTYYVSCTINPILYNVMSHRYRVAFKDILCGKRRSVYYNNGFARDQSSFRETTVATSLGGASSANHTNYDRLHSVRIKSIRHMNNVKDRESIKSNNALWMKKAEFAVPVQKDIPEDPTTAMGTNIVVVVDNGVNGRPKVFTENEAQESLITENNETCI